MINTASSYKGGGIQVAKSYIEEFKKFPENKYYVVLSKGLSDAIDLDSFPTNFQFFKAPFRPATKFFSFQSHNHFLKKIERDWKPDAVFSIGGPSYWRSKTLHIMGFTIPHYIYSESPYFDQISFKRNLGWKARKMLAQFLFKRDADVLVTQTDDVKNRVKKFLNKDKVFTVYNTINTYYSNPIKVKNKLPAKFKNEFRLLTLSAWYPHKNIAIIPTVANILIHSGYGNITFVLTLPDEDFNKLRLDADNQMIKNIGPVKIDEGASLYQECDAMFLPTLLECFSASYAEAMMMNKPIITSDMGFAHTVCKDAALYIDPMNAEDIAENIIKLYKDNVLRKSLIEKGRNRLSIFGSAEERAKRILKIAKQLIDEN